eukprot:TRINITY_DN2018_c0_g1_i3.p1 TRINITY_DN2018_c0_g1~~TRINITY_DN2018_c0_g1_i3.p1  ORF type:complete len:107 (+),score=40.50 TRINITY_DN2018_c0_g1_i3:119-439(+)
MCIRDSCTQSVSGRNRVKPAWLEEAVTDSPEVTKKRPRPSLNPEYPKSSTDSKRGQQARKTNGYPVGAAGVARSEGGTLEEIFESCLLYTSPSPRDRTRSRMPSSA